MSPQLQSEPISPASVRRADLNDVPAILTIERASPGAAHWNPEQYKSRIQASGACFLIAESERSICGFVCARIVGDEWEIENVVVAETFRHHGIATHLMRSLIARWNELAGKSIFLEVRESNAAARALYAKHGLQEVGRRRAYYRDPVEDAVLYALHRPL